MKIRNLTILTCISVSLLGGATGRGAELDQSFEPTAKNVMSGFAQDVLKAQTFTVGKAGELDQLDVYISAYEPAHDAAWELRATQPSGAPVENGLLASGTIAKGNVPMYPGWVSIDTSSFDLMVDPGDVLAIVLSGIDPAGGGFPDYWWTGDYGAADPYSGGAAYVRNQYYPTWTAMESITVYPADTKLDCGFRTYVSSTVPEAASLFVTASLLVPIVAGGVSRLRDRR